MKQKVLIKLPSRGRKDRFFKAIDSIYNNTADRENTIISCTLDTDDEVMNCKEVKERIAEYEIASIEWGLSKSKIDAINRSMPDFDILVISSDDIYFNIYGFDEIIRQEMNAHFPNGEGYLHFHEKDSGAALNVMTVIDKKYYKKFNYVYHPEYISLFADNHQMDVAKILGRYIYIPYSIMEHRNPAYSEYKEVKDEMFIEQQKIGWSVDQLKYEEMKGRNYDLHLLNTQQ